MSFERFDRLPNTEAYKPQSRALPPFDIQIRTDWNPRTMTSPETRQNIDAIKASILQRIGEDPPLPALQMPVDVTYDRQTGITTLAHGECRLTACRELWKEGHKLYVDCRIAEGDEQQLLASNMTGNGGTPLTQWELGTIFRRLNVGYRWSVDRIAAHAMKPRRYVTEAIALSQVDTEAKQMMAAGEVTAGAVLHAVKEKNGNQAAAVAELKEKVKAKEPRQAMISGTPRPKPEPVTRPKAPSAKDAIAKAAPSLLELADAMCRLFFDQTIPDWKQEVTEAAKAYKNARGL